MGVESADDRAAFFSADEFGVEATYALAGGGETAIAGIYDAGHRRVEGLGTMPITSAEPMFRCRAADLPDGAAQGAGDTLTIDGTAWRVVEIQPSDDTALVTLILSR